MAWVLSTVTYKDASGNPVKVQAYVNNTPTPNEFVPSGILFDHLGNVLSVDIGGGVGALKVATLNMPQVIGSVAHDSPDTQPPVKIGGYASANLRTAVTEADRVDASFDLQGQLRVLPGALPAGSALIGDVSLQPRTSGGLSIYRSIDLDETEEEVKGSAGQIYAYYFANLHATAARFLKFYNDTAANVVVGTTTPLLTIPLIAQQAGHLPIPQGWAFSAAITVAATTGVADADTGAPGANEVVFGAWYK